MKNIFIKLLLFLASLTQLTANANVVFYNSNIGLGSSVIDISRYTNTQREQQDVYKNSMGISINEKITNEILGAKYIDLLDKKYFSQVLPIKEFSIVTQNQGVAVLRNKDSKEFYKTIGLYEDFKDNVLAYINQNTSLYNQLSRNVGAFDKANIYFMAFYVPTVKGRVDTYEKVGSDSNNIYSIETSLNTRVNVAIYKYYKSTNRFRFYKEIKAPSKNIGKVQDSNTFRLNRVINANDIKNAVTVKMNRMLNSEIAYLKRELAKDSDFSLKNSIVDIDKNSVFDVSKTKAEVVKEDKSQDIFKEKIPKKEEKIQEASVLDEEIPMSKLVSDEVVDDLPSRNKLLVFLDINNVALVNNNKKLNSLAYSFGLGYRGGITDSIFWNISGVYSAFSIGNNLPKLDGVFVTTVLNEIYQPVDNSNSYSGALGLDVMLFSTESLYMSFGANVSMDVLNVEYKDFVSKYNPRIMYLFAEPTLNMGYKISQNFELSLSLGYSVPIYNVGYDLVTVQPTTNADRTQSIVNKFTRESEPSAYIGMSYYFD